MMSAVVVPLAAVAAVVSAPVAGAAVQPPCAPLTKFSALNFPASPTAGSRLLPLVPGAQRVLEGRSNVSGRSLPHQVTFTVTDLTKIIAGVRTVVVHDIDVSDGQVSEEELAFFAEDVQGNVWNLGEYPEEHLAGGLLRAPSTWMAGIDGAVPGIHMPTVLPSTEAPPYLQGFVPKIDFLDCAQTFSVGTTACVPAGCFGGVVITDETSPLDVGSGSQRKTYAPGIGIIDVGFVDDPQGERLVLIDEGQLGGQGLADVRAATLTLDARGYATNPTYRRSPPAEPLATAPQPAALAANADAFPDAPSSSRRARAGRVSLSLTGGARRVTRAGTVALRVRCATPANRVTVRPGRCHGRVDLFRHATRARVGTARFSVRGGLAHTLRIRLSEAALRPLRAGRRVSLDARTHAAVAGAERVVARASLTLVRG